MQLPEKDSLVQQTVLAIKVMIRDGELVSPIPGERYLASKLQIGRDTLRSALTELTQQGWISESAQGRRRQILKTPTPEDFLKKKKSKVQRVIFFSPQSTEQIPRYMLIELNALRAFFDNRSIKVEILTSSVFENLHPEKRLEQLVSDHPADAWILHRCTEPVQRWFQEKNIPCIIRGYPHSGITIPFIDEDWKAAAYHAGNHLLQKGHKSIGIVMPDAPLQGLKAAEQGLREAATKDNQSVHLHQILEKKDLPSLIQSMQKALSSPHPPTALLLTRSRHVIHLTSWLATFGYSIPEHLSVVALSHESWFSDFYSPITHYRTPPETIARTLAKQLKSLLAKKSLTNKSTFIIPSHIAGKSVKTLS